MLVMAAVTVFGLWYAAGAMRLWHHAGIGHGLSRGQVGWFAAGWLALAASVWPAFDPMTDALFSAHMVQHLSLILIVAPLMVLGCPVTALVWAFPEMLRHALSHWWSGRGGLVARRCFDFATLPVIAWILHAFTLAFWHLPNVYALALDHEAVHAIEHVSFLATAALFWWVVLQPVGHRRLGYGAAILYIGALMTLMGIFSAVLIFARQPWYLSYPASYGLTRLQDQELAGAIMWVPAAGIYLLAMSVCFMEWLRTDEPEGLSYAPR